VGQWEKKEESVEVESQLVHWYSQGVRETGEEGEREGVSIGIEEEGRMSEDGDEGGREGLVDRQSFWVDRESLLSARETGADKEASFWSGIERDSALLDEGVDRQGSVKEGSNRESVDKQDECERERKSHSLTLTLSSINGTNSPISDRQTLLAPKKAQAKPVIPVPEPSSKIREFTKKSIGREREGVGGDGSNSERDRERSSTIVSIWYGEIEADGDWEEVDRESFFLIRTRLCNLSR
jgi:hypothetical protein